MQLSCRSKKLSQRRLSSSRPPFCIQPATVRASFFLMQMVDNPSIGERRIRVITTAYPVTSNLSEVFASADQVAIATLLANKAVERTITHKLEDARDAVQNKLVEILQAYKTSMTAAGAGASAQLAVCENMRMLPVLVLGLLKNVGIRQSAQIPPDLRAYAQALLTSLPPQLLIPYIHPTFYSLHNMPPEVISFQRLVPVYSHLAGWGRWRTWRHHATAATSHLRKTRKAWSLLDRRRSDALPLGRTRFRSSVDHRCI
jgi:Sec23/Sec24 helical domain